MSYLKALQISPKNKKATYNVLRLLFIAPEAGLPV